MGYYKQLDLERKEQEMEEPGDRYQEAYERFEERLMDMWDEQKDEGYCWDCGTKLDEDGKCSICDE